MKTLTWKVTKTIPTECPDYKPDPYTGEFPMRHCLVYHCKTVVEERAQSFETNEEARLFADNAPLSCTDFKLDGEVLEDKRAKPDTKFYTGLVGDGTTTTSGTSTTGSIFQPSNSTLES